MSHHRTAILILAVVMSCGESPDALTSIAQEVQTPPTAPESLVLPGTPIINGVSAGYLPASWEVTPTGRFTYTIPIEVPKGRAGMEPELAVTYSSGRGNGLFGVGWSLSAGSEITRCHRTMISDGAVDGVDVGDVSTDPGPERDRLCLDGKKLAAIDGQYGVAGSEYRTEQETYARIRAEGPPNNDPLQFRVWLKSGRIRTYTAVLSTRLRATSSQVVTEGAPVAVRWQLSEERDRLGNTITYAYKDYGGDALGVGQQLLDMITYTGFGSQPGHRKVTFRYEERPDVETSWRAGFRTQRSMRLASITMHAPNPSTTQSVWIYRFGYTTPSTSTGRSLLDSVQRCGMKPDGQSQGGCLWKKSFDWYASSSLSFTTKDLVTTDIWTDVWLTLRYVVSHVLDADGDGSDDILFQPGKDVGDLIPMLFASRGVSPPYQDKYAPLGFAFYLPDSFTNTVEGLVNARPIDIDGDGRSELFTELRLPPSGLDTERTIRRWMPSKRFEPALTFPTRSHGWNRNVFADLDGDGLLDYLTFYISTWQHLRNTGSAFVSSGTPDLANGRVYAVDSDGDGRAEMFGVRAGSGVSTYYRQLDDGTMTVVDDPHVPVSDGDQTLNYGDFNGDGLQDVVSHRQDTTPPSLRLRWNTGNGYTPHVVIANPGIDLAKATSQIRVGDVNADGRADLIVIHKHPLSQITLMLSRGDGTFTTSNVPGDAGVWLDEVAADVFPTTKIGDFNGDGALDLTRVVVQPSGQGTLQAVFQTPQRRDLLHSVQDSVTLWKRQTITYDTVLSDKPEPRISCAYPLRCGARGLVVVREVESREHLFDPTNTSSDVRTLYYSYEDPVADVRGRGFLGFRKFKIWDPSRPMETVLTFDHRAHPAGKAWAFAMRPASRRVAIGLELPAERPKMSKINARISLTTNKGELATFHTGASYDDRPSEWHTEEWEDEVVFDWGGIDPDPDNPTSDHVFGIDPPLAPHVREGSFVFDAYGNVTTSTTSTVGGTTSTTSTIWDNRFASWLVSLPTFECTTASSATATPVTRCLTYEYDALGQRTKVIREKDAADLSLRSTTSYAYDPTGVPVAITRTALDGNGVQASREIRIEYAPMWPGQPDEKVFPSQVWTPLDDLARRPSRWYAFHPAYGVRSAWMDANGVQGVAVHDDLGRVRTSTSDGEAPVTIGYTARSDTYGGINGLVHTTTIAGVQTRVEVDAPGREIKRTEIGFDGSPIHTKQRFDRLGRLVSKSRPYAGAAPTHLTSYKFDPLDRLLSTTNPDATQSTNTYDYDTTHAFDELAHETITTRDKDGRIVQVTHITSGGPISTQYRYAAFGAVDRITDASGNLINVMLDRWDRVMQNDDPDAGVTTLAYDGFDQVVTKSHVGANETTRFTYDALGRVTSSAAPDGTTSMTWDTATHGIGSLASATSADGVVTSHSYDANGRAVSTDQQLGASLYRTAWTWDGLGRLDRIYYPALDNGTEGFTVRHVYNAANQLAEVRNATNGASTLLWQVTARNLDHRLTTATLGNGYTASRAYHPAHGRPTTIQLKNGATDLIRVVTGYHANGLPWTRTDTVISRIEAFEYDELARLTEWSTNYAATLRKVKYRYDATGNLDEVSVGGGVTETNTYGEGDAGPHAVTSRIADGVAMKLEYDARGRQTLANQRTLEDYTSFSLPRTVTNNGATTRLVYNAFGERARKRTPTRTTDYVSGLYERRDEGGAITHVYRVYTPDGPVAEVTRTGVAAAQVRYLATDPLGSIIASVSPTGALERLFFEPFGRRIAPTGLPPAVASISNRGFTGQEHDDEAGLVNLVGRLYDPALKRILTPDPHIRYPFFGQNWNPYSYALNSPLAFTDPTGLDPQGMYEECTAWVGGCDALDLLDGVADPIGSTLGQFQTAFETGMGSMGWPGASGTGTSQSSEDGYGEAWSGSWDVPSLVEGISASLGDAARGPPAPCDSKGNPSCGSVAEREATRSALIARIDDEVLSWMFRRSPARISAMSNLTGTELLGIEHGAVIVVGEVVSPDGKTKTDVPRLVGASSGTPTDPNINIAAIPFRDGDRIVGIVHSHPPPGKDGAHFSKIDIDGAKQAAKGGNTTHPDVGILYYMMRPQETGGGMLVFDVSRNTVTPVTPSRTRR
jgi:RHS repeat-associated protein